MDHERRGRHRWTRFSIRKLVFVVTLFCAYLASWRVTVTHGVPDAAGMLAATKQVGVIDDSVPFPFVVGLDESLSTTAIPTGVLVNHTNRRYYFWFFGYIAKLPFERIVRYMRN